MDRRRKITISLVILSLFLVMVGSVLAYTYTNTLLVDTVPTGAQIYAGGIYKGNSPVRITNLYDTETNNYHTILIDKLGYKEAIEYVSTPAGSNNVLNITLESAYTFTNTFTVNTIPEGANVTVVGVIKGLNRQAYTPDEYAQAFPEKTNVTLTNLADTNPDAEYNDERTHFLTIKKEGYAPYYQFIETPAGSNNVINVVLNPVPQVRFVVTSEPTEAMVRTESAGYAGYTPIDVNKTVQDYTNYYTYRLILEKQGYFTDTSYHSLRAGDTKVYHVAMKRVDSTGAFWVRTSPGASWRLTKTGHPGYQGIINAGGAGGNNRVDLGTYTLRVSKVGYVQHVSTTDIASPNSVNANNQIVYNYTIVDVALVQTGSLSVTSSPTGAQIYVDNVYKGLTPRTVTYLAPGERAVRLVKSGYQDYNTLVTVNSGQTTTLSATLTPQ